MSVYGVPVAYPYRTPNRYFDSRQLPTTFRLCRRSCPGKYAQPSPWRAVRTAYVYEIQPLNRPSPSNWRSNSRRRTSPVD